MDQSLFIPRPDRKIKEEKQTDLSKHTCSACKFDGSKPVKMRGQVKDFPNGCVVEYETVKSQSKESIIYQKHVHCPACGFWDHISQTREQKLAEKEATK